MVEGFVFREKPWDELVDQRPDRSTVTNDRKQKPATVMHCTTRCVCKAFYFGPFCPLLRLRAVLFIYIFMAAYLNFNTAAVRVRYKIIPVYTKKRKRKRQKKKNKKGVVSEDTNEFKE